MTLRADSQGFLIGELVESSHEQADILKIGNRSLGRIDSNVSAIARALGVATRAGSAAKVQEPAGRGTGGGRTSAGGSPGQRRAMPAQRSGFGGPNAIATASPAGRDSRGRFTARAAGGKSGDGGRDQKGRFTAGDGGESGDEDFGGGGSGFLNRMGRLTDAIRGATDGTEQMDSTLVAAKEIKDVVAPLGRGVMALFGRSDAQKKEGWFKKIWKSLRNIEDKPAAGATGGNSSGFSIGLGGGGLLGGAKGLLGGMFKGAGGLLKGGAKGVGGLLKGAGGLLRRVPILGALLAGGGALASIFGDDDPSKSADENRNEKYKGVGGSVGMVAGGALGAAIGTLAGPVGTIVGGYLGSMGGEIIGEKVGEWTKSLVDADIPGKIVSAWDGFMASAKERWEAMKGGADALWTDAKNLAQKGVDKAVDLGNKANDAIKNTTGIDVKKTAQDAGAKVSDAAKSTGEFVAENAPKLVPNSIRRMANLAGNAGAVLNAGIEAGMGPKELAQSAGRVAGSMGFRKVLKAGDGSNMVERADGSVVRQEGARNWRNNNPGNIEYGQFAISKGAIGSDGRFAIFPDYDAGRKAKESLIFEGDGGQKLSTKGDYGAGLGYRNKTLTQAIAAYAPKEENNTAAYQSAVLASVGGQNKKMADYTPAERAAIMDSMQKVEGFKVGKTSTVVMPGMPAAGTQPMIKMTSVASGNPAYTPPTMPTLAATKIPAIPDVQIPAPSTAKDKPLEVSVKQPIGQEVGDRGIANVAGGGIGRPRGW